MRPLGLLWLQTLTGRSPPGPPRSFLRSGGHHLIASIVKEIGLLASTDDCAPLRSSETLRPKLGEAVDDGQGVLGLLVPGFWGQDAVDVVFSSPGDPDVRVGVDGVHQGFNPTPNTLCRCRDHVEQLITS